MNEGAQIITLLLFGVGAIALIGFMLLSNARENSKRALQTGQRVTAEANEWLASIKQHDLLPVESSIILKADEAAYYEAPSALYETRAVRYSAGGGFRVAKGLYLGGARSLSEQEWTQIDVGTLTVTNQRLVFNGAKADRVVPLKKIVSANAASQSQVEVTAESRQKSMVFDAANPIILATIFDWLCRRAS